MCELHFYIIILFLLYLLGSRSFNEISLLCALFYYYLRFLCNKSILFDLFLQINLKEAIPKYNSSNWKSTILLGCILRTPSIADHNSGQFIAHKTFSSELRKAGFLNIKSYEIIKGKSIQEEINRPHEKAPETKLKLFNLRQTSLEDELKGPKKKIKLVSTTSLLASVIESCRLYVKNKLERNINEAVDVNTVTT